MIPLSFPDGDQILPSVVQIRAIITTIKKNSLKLEKCNVVANGSV